MSNCPKAKLLLTQFCLGLWHDLSKILCDLSMILLRPEQIIVQWPLSMQALHDVEGTCPSLWEDDCASKHLGHRWGALQNIRAISTVSYKKSELGAMECTTKHEGRKLKFSTPLAHFDPPETFSTHPASTVCASVTPPL